MSTNSFGASACISTKVDGLTEVRFTTSQIPLPSASQAVSTMSPRPESVTYQSVGGPPVLVETEQPGGPPSVGQPVDMSDPSAPQRRSTPVTCCWGLGTLVGSKEPSRNSVPNT